MELQAVRCVTAAGCVRLPIQNIVLARAAKGVWDAVDTSPDLGG